MIDTNTFTLNASAQLSTPRGGLEAFRWAVLLGRACRILGWVTGRPNRLKSLDSVQFKNRGAQHEAGLRTVPIRRIQGTEGRTHDFDRAFHPLTDNTRGRWLSIYNAQTNGVGLPAVELVRVGDDYYVRDGHHRISVARTLGQQFIDARVIEIGQ